MNSHSLARELAQCWEHQKHGGGKAGCYTGLSSPSFYVVVYLLKERTKSFLEYYLTINSKSIKGGSHHLTIVL